MRQANFVADDILIYLFFLIFQWKLVLTFHVNFLQTIQKKYQDLFILKNKQ